MDSNIDGRPAQGWYNDPTGRHELRWFSAGSPTALVRDAADESRDALTAEERTLPATAGPGLTLPEKSGGVDGRPGPVAWWDTAVPNPGEPTIADIGISGYQGYEIIRGVRLAQRVSRWRYWWPAVAVVAVVVAVSVLVLASG